MNLECGFKRITLLVSIIVGLVVFFLCFVLIASHFEYERDQYNDYKEDYENIAYFWRIWDANGWKSGRKGVIQHLLDSEVKYKGAPFTIGGETVYLKPYEVFPSINRDMLYMPSDVLDVKTQAIKRNAIQTAKKNMEKFEYWGKKSLSQIILMSIGFALLVGVISFSLVWLLFFLIRWLALGFCTEKPKEEQNIK